MGARKRDDGDVSSLAHVLHFNAAFNAENVKRSVKCVVIIREARRTKQRKFVRGNYGGLIVAFVSPQ